MTLVSLAPQKGQCMVAGNKKREAHGRASRHLFPALQLIAAFLWRIPLARQYLRFAVYSRAAGGVKFIRLGNTARRASAAP